MYPAEPTESPVPFLKVTLTASKSDPGLPFSTKDLPGLDSTIVQPPLPASQDVKSPEDVGTNRFFQFEATAESPRGRNMTIAIEQADPQTELGALWPTFNPLPVGLWLENTTLVVPEPTLPGPHLQPVEVQAVPSEKPKVAIQA